MKKSKLSVAALRESYRRDYLKYQKFAYEIQRIVQDLLSRENLGCLVTSRVKSEDSFLEKAFRPGKSYANPLFDITDIVGVRIVMTNPNDLSKVSRMVLKCFQMNQKHSENTAQRLGVNEFGYRSHHIVARVRSSLAGVPAVSECRKMWFEIQIRTLLEHAWDEISHRLAYKRASSSPGHSSERVLYQTAAVLELCDKLTADLWRQIHKESVDAEREVSRKHSAQTLHPLLCRAYLSTPAVSAVVVKAESCGLIVLRRRSTAGALFSAARLAGIATLGSLNHVVIEITDSSCQWCRLLQMAQKQVMGVSVVSADFLVGFLIAAKYEVLPKWLQDNAVHPVLAAALCPVPLPVKQPTVISLGSQA